MSTKLRLKIRHKALAMTLAIVFISNLMLVAVYFYFVRVIRAKSDNYNSEMAIRISQEIDRYFNELDMSMFTLSSLPSFQSFVRGMEVMSSDEYDQQYKTLRNNITLLANPREYVSIHIFPSSAAKLAIIDKRNDTGAWVTSDYNFQNEAWYHRLSSVKNNKLKFTRDTQKYFMDRSRQEVVSCAYKIIANDDRSTIGYLMADVDLDFLQDFLPTTSTDIYLAIRDESGVFFQSSGFPDVREKYAEQKVLLQALGWELTALTPYDNMINDYRFLPIVFAAVDLLVLLFFVFITNVMAKSITLPIEKLTREIQSADENSLRSLEIISSDESAQLTMVYNNLIDRIKRLIKNNENAAILQKEAQLAALRNQINPHFIHNTLQITIGFACENDFDGVINICQKLGKMLAYNTDEQDESDIGKELNHVKSFIYILERRMDNRFVTEYIVDESMLCRPCLKFILQPFVENAILHGFKNTLEGGRLIISILPYGSDCVEFKISDNGCGLPQDELSKLNERADADFSYTPQAHIGVRNVFGRIMLKYGSRASFGVVSEESVGTTVWMRCPC